MASTFKIEYLPTAQKDLTEILEYINEDNPTAALEFLDAIDSTISKLEDFPFLGHIPKDNRLKALGYRILVVNNYLVFYIVADNIVEIRRILHGKRKYDFII